MPHTGSTAKAGTPPKGRFLGTITVFGSDRSGPRTSLSPNRRARPSGPNRMKVAMVTPYWFPVRGGVTTYVAELSGELRRSFSVDVHILAREGGAPGATILGGDARAFARRAVAELERGAPDVVHAHGHWYALLAAVRYRDAHPGVRIVFTLHTEFPRPSRVRRALLRRLLSQADC